MGLKLEDSTTFGLVPQKHYDINKKVTLFLISLSVNI